MPSNVVFFVSSSGYRTAWQSMSMGLTAAAMGDSVTFVFAFEALRAVAAGTFGAPADDTEREEAERGERLGAARPVAMLADARSLGARAVACDTTVKLTGLSREELERAGCLDAVLGLPEIWRLTQSGRVVSM